MVWLWGAVFAGLLALVFQNFFVQRNRWSYGLLSSRAAHVSASPTAASDMPPGTTAELGFFQKFFKAAKGLVWQDPSPAVMTTAPTLSGPSTSTRTPVPFRVAESKEVARMNFSLRVLSEHLSSAVEPGTYTEGSTIHMEARVHASPGLFPKIFVDECFGTDTVHSSHARRVYIIVDNHGCLYPGELETKATWFRKEDSAIVFTLPAFLLTSGPEEKIYIHCFLTAWSQRIPTNPSKKACYFDGLSSRWRNIDEPSKTSVCICCDSYCPSTSVHHGSRTAFAGEGRLHREVVGPLMIQKEKVPWFEGQCHTMKKLTLVSIAFVGSCVLAALFVGTLLALALTLLRYSCTSRGHRLLQNTKEQPFHTELQAVVGTIAEVDETEEESNLDYCKLKADTPEKA